MRPEDLTDFLRLRRIVHNPWEVLRFRKSQRTGRTLEVQLRDGAPLFIRGGYADFHMFHRIFLRDEYRLEDGRHERWRCILDLGGNVGMFAVRASALAPLVITLEPSPAIFAQLTTNVRGRQAVRPIRAAIAGKPGTLRLYRPLTDGLSGASSARSGRGCRVSDEYDEVPSVTIDSLFEEHDVESCDLLKIDVEGMEYEALEATSEKTLARIQRIHGEYHEVGAGENRIDGLVCFLESRGYGVERLPHRKKRHHGMFFASRLVTP